MILTLDKVSQHVPIRVVYAQMSLSFISRQAQKRT